MANKEELTRIAQSLGIDVQNDWTKKIIIEHIEAAQRMLANENASSGEDAERAGDQVSGEFVSEDDEKSSFESEEEDGNSINVNSDDFASVDESSETNANEAFRPVRRDKRAPATVLTTRGRMRVLS